MRQEGSSLQDIITQLVSISLYSLKVDALEDSAKVQLKLGSAIEHCKKNEKIDPKMLVQLFEMIFPGQSLPKAVSDEEFKEIVSRQQSGNS